MKNLLCSIILITTALAPSWAQHQNSLPLGNEIFINKLRLSRHIVLNNEKVADTLVLYNLGKENISFQIPRTSKTYFSTEPTQAFIAPGDSALIICTIDGSKSPNYGGNSIKFPIKVHHTDIVIFATWIVLEDFSYLSEEELHQAPKITINKPEFLFDSVSSGTLVNATFNITNTGKTDLIIRRIKPACGCTIVDIAKDTIAAGKTVQITGQLNTEGMKGDIFKAITITCNDPSNPSVKLIIKGAVYEN